MLSQTIRRGSRSVLVLLVAMATVLTGAVAAAGPAAAEPVDLTGLALTVNRTGSGYGTAAQCWLQPAGAGPSDGDVCTNDTVELGWAFTAPAAASPDPIVLSQTLPTGWTWSSTTALACAGSAALGFTGVSAISGDGRTLTCTVAITPGTGVIAELAMTATPGSSAAPGAPYTAELSVDNGTGAVTLSADKPVTVLSAPNADAFLGTPNGANTGYETIDGTEYYYGGYVLAVTGRNSKGNQTLVVPYSFATDLSTFPAGTTVTITRCPFGVACTWDPGTQRIIFTTTSTDGYIQSPIGANVAFTVYVPSAAGPVTLTASIADFEPVGIFDAIPNTEPSLTNNSVTRQFLGPQADVPIPPGGRATTMLACPAGVDVTAFNGPCEVNSTFAASNLVRVETTDPVWTKVAVYNGRLTGGTIVPITDPLVCDYWDPAVYSLDTSRAVEVSRYDGSPYNPVDYVLEYSDATWPDPQDLGIHGGTQCTDNPASWSTDPAGLGPVTAVRARYVGTGSVLGTATDPAISAFQLTIPQTMGDVARGQWFNVGKIDFAENPTTPALTRIPYARVGGYEFTLAQASVPATVISSGDSATFTITPDIRPLTHPEAPVEGLEIRVTVDACLSVPTFSAETLAAWAVAVVDEGSQGADGIACTRDADEAPRVYALTPIGPLTASSDLVPVTYTATSTINAPPDGNVVSGASISSDEVPAVLADRTVQVLQVRASTLQKTASVAAVLPGRSLTWTATVVNQLPTSLGRTQVVDVLPRVGDTAGNGASAFLDGPVELYGNLIGSVVEYTTDPAPSSDPQSPATSWSGTAPGGDWSAVTGVRVTIASYGANFLGTVRLSTTVDDAVAGANVTNRVTGVAALDTATPVALPTGSATVQALTFSAGDLAWNDVDGDGAYTAGVDVPVPDGTTVRLLPAAGGTPVATTTTTDGLYLFDGLDAGEYIIEIPAVELAAGGHLAGWTVSTAPPAGTTEEEINLNDDVAHDARVGPGGSVVSPPFTLSAETLPDGTVIGNAPLGDNIHGLVDSTRDDLSNLSVDLALVPTASLDLRAVVVDPTIAGAARPSSYDVVVTCVPPVGGEDTRTVSLPADGPVRSVEGLTAGSQCTVTGPVTRATAVGPVMTVDPTSVIVSSEGSELVTVTFTYAAGSLVVEKDLTGVGTPLVSDRTFGFGVVCTLDDVSILDDDVVIDVPPEATTGTADPVEGLPLGAECTVTEDGRGTADATPAPVVAVIDEETATVVRVTNSYSAATVVVALSTDGELAGQPLVADQEYTVDVACLLPAPASGPPGALLGETVTLRAGERVPVTTEDGPLVVPTGTRCFVQSTDAPVLRDVSTSASGPDDAEPVAPGDAQVLQEVDLLVTVTFPVVHLTVAADVAGPAPSPVVSFEVTCALPDGEPALPDAETTFELTTGGSRTLDVFPGADCEVDQVSPTPSGGVPTVTVALPDGTVEAGPRARLLALTADARVQFTTTYPQVPTSPVGPTPPQVPAPSGGLAQTGAEMFTLAMAGMVMLTAGALLRRRRSSAPRPETGAP